MASSTAWTLRVCQIVPTVTPWPVLTSAKHLRRSRPAGFIERGQVPGPALASAALASRAMPAVALCRVGTSRGCAPTGTWVQANRAVCAGRTRRRCASTFPLTGLRSPLAKRSWVPLAATPTEEPGMLPMQAVASFPMAAGVRTELLVQRGMGATHARAWRMDPRCAPNVTAVPTRGVSSIVPAPRRDAPGRVAAAILQHAERWYASMRAPPTPVGWMPDSLTCARSFARRPLPAVPTWAVAAAHPRAARSCVPTREREPARRPVVPPERVAVVRVSTRPTIHSTAAAAVWLVREPRRTATAAGTAKPRRAWRPHRVEPALPVAEPSAVAPDRSVVNRRVPSHWVPNA